MALKIVVLLVFFAAMVEFSGLCHGQGDYLCIFTGCKREVCTIVATKTSEFLIRQVNVFLFVCNKRKVNELGCSQTDFHVRKLQKKKNPVSSYFLILSNPVYDISVLCLLIGAERCPYFFTWEGCGSFERIQTKQAVAVVRHHAKQAKPVWRL